MSYLSRILMARLAVFLDAVVRRSARLVPSLEDAGVFYRGDLPLTHFDCWTEHSSRIIQVGKLEVIFDFRILAPECQ